MADRVIGAMFGIDHSDQARPIAATTVRLPLGEDIAAHRLHRAAVARALVVLAVPASLEVPEHCPFSESLTGLHVAHVDLT
jgi:hypothetical protein